jgi:hypothetical protein
LPFREQQKRNIFLNRRLRYASLLK